MRPLGLITPGRVLALLSLCVIGVGLQINGGQMFSPGELNDQGRRGVTLGGVAAHADLGRKCSACHVSPWSGGTMAGRCLDCHADVRRQLDAHQPLHGSFSDGRQCRGCHTEHAGAHGVLTTFGKFDHDLTDFKLTGKHTTVGCAACHVNSVFVGTAKSCAACHAEPQTHQGRFGTNCAQCHSTTTWHGTDRGPGFNHNLSQFKLTGKHATVACAACHVNNVFQGTAKTCAACHSEPQSHKGRFGNDCAQCHSTSTWVGATFKHTFPLDHHNKRQQIVCATCHARGDDFHSYTCYGCHAHEQSKMERKHARLNVAELAQCARCHPTGHEHKGDRGRDREWEKQERDRKKAERDLEKWLNQGKNRDDDE